MPTALLQETQEANREVHVDREAGGMGADGWVAFSPGEVDIGTIIREENISSDGSLRRSAGVFRVRARTRKSMGERRMSMGQ